MAADPIMAYYTRKQRPSLARALLPSLHPRGKRPPPPEPACFPVFRWSLMLLGLAGLAVVVLIMAQLAREMSQTQGRMAAPVHTTTTPSSPATTAQTTTQPPPEVSFAPL